MRFGHPVTQARTSSMPDTTRVPASRFASLRDTLNGTSPNTG